MEEKKRKFKLRNGGIVEEKSYPYNFIILKDPNDLFAFREEICLIPLNLEDFPSGMAHGPDYDIVEKILI